MEDCLHRAENLSRSSEIESIKKCVGYYLLSTEPDQGLKLGLKFVKGKEKI